MKTWNLVTNDFKITKILKFKNDQVELSNWEIIEYFSYFIKSKYRPLAFAQSQEGSASSGSIVQS